MSETSKSINLIEPGNRQIVWNKASLNAAAMLPASYERYLSEDLDQAPSELRNTLSHIVPTSLLMHCRLPSSRLNSRQITRQAQPGRHRPSMMWRHPLTLC